jgi:hypothetical protein
MESTTPKTASGTALDVRDRIVEALELDLIGPWPGHELADEKLQGRTRPSNWYLTGFLVPLDAPAEESGDIDAEEELGEVQVSTGPVEEGAEEPGAAEKGFFPTSMRLSTLVARAATSLSATVSWGDYARSSGTSCRSSETPASSRSSGASRRSPRGSPGTPTMRCSRRSPS